MQLEARRHTSMQGAAAAAAAATRRVLSLGSSGVVAWRPGSCCAWGAAGSTCHRGRHVCSSVPAAAGAAAAGGDEEGRSLQAVLAKVRAAVRGARPLDQAAPHANVGRGRVSVVCVCVWLSSAAAVYACWSCWRASACGCSCGSGARQRVRGARVPMRCCWRRAPRGSAGHCVWRGRAHGPAGCVGVHVAARRRVLRGGEQQRSAENERCTSCWA
jgi:hypothetical protein